jgi:1-acyl-sn-glycerol-3-phosphate acyltransferase
MKKIYAFLFRIAGWKSDIRAEILPKCVICVAPHTSNWDFILGMLFFKSIGGEPHILMKKSWFFFPLKYILEALGGIPVNRSQRSSLTEQMQTLFAKRKHFQLAIAPEGTRKKNPHWKSGFYYIAWESKVPITLAYLDYAKKMIGVFENFIPTGNLSLDLVAIKQRYLPVAGRHPAQFAI